MSCKARPELLRAAEDETMTDKKEKDYHDMHELPIVKKIIENVERYAREEQATRVLKVNLQIGCLHDLIDEWVEKYYVFASKDTILEGSKLHIRRTPVICACSDCKEYFTIDMKEQDTGECPVCGSKHYRFIFGNELIIQSVELETADELQPAVGG